MKQRAFSAAVVYMPCLRTGISDSWSVPAWQSDCWIPGLNLLGIVCASGACYTCVMGEEEDRRFEEGKDERKEGRRDHFGTMQEKHVWFMAFHP